MNTSASCSEINFMIAFFGGNIRVLQSLLKHQSEDHTLMVFVQKERT